MRSFLKSAAAVSIAGLVATASGLADPIEVEALVYANQEAALKYCPEMKVFDPARRAAMKRKYGGKRVVADTLKYWSKNREAFTQSRCLSLGDGWLKSLCPVLLTSRATPEELAQADRCQAIGRQSQ
jgi:hypothetical protein